MNQLPEAFEKRLKQIIPESSTDRVMRSFSVPKALSVRINLLKTTRESVLKTLHGRGIQFSEISWFKDALILDDMDKRDAGEMDLIKKGEIYIQNLSSMFVALVLDPKPGEAVLDMCAAPGSKTCQMATMMENQGDIIAIDRVKSRFFKLKAIVDLCGVENVKLKLMDGRRFRPENVTFEKILVDAPCSSEGRFATHNPKTFSFWSLRKIKEMRKKQKGLLLCAARLLKPDGVLVYSTCTFSPEENEEVVSWALKKQEGELEAMPIMLENIESYPPILRWNNKDFDPQLKETVRILPNQEMAAFYIAKLRKTI